MTSCSADESIDKQALPAGKIMIIIIYNNNNNNNNNNNIINEINDNVFWQQQGYARYIFIKNWIKIEFKLWFTIFMGV